MGNKQSNDNKSHIENLIDTAFSRASSNQYLTMQEFNQSLKVFESVNIMFICNTFLASRLFQVFDADKKGRIQKADVIQKFKGCTKDPQKCMKLTFKLYDTDQDKTISRRQFSDFFQLSWASSIEIVISRLKNLESVNAQQLSLYLRQKRQEISQVSGFLFNEISESNQNYISYREFQKWVKQGRHDMMVFKYEDVLIRFPLNLDALINVAG